MNKERLERIFFLIFIGIGALVIFFLLIKYLLPALLPFFIAWAIALAVRSPSEYISRKTRISRKIISPTIAVLLMLAAVFAIGALTVALASQGWELLSGIVKDGELEEFIRRILNPFEGRLEGAFSEEITGHLNTAVGELISGALSALAHLLTEVVSGVPRLLFFLLITLISTVYFCIDIDRVNRFVINALPERARKTVFRIKKNSFTLALKYLRSYSLIMLITFAVMLVGFTLLKVRYALLLAAIVALLDALPVLGVGTFLVPYSIISFVRGNSALGIGLIILLIVHEVIRQTAEPKILGKHLGLHPLVTVISLYAGYSLFGLVGLLLFPFLAAALCALVVKNKTAEVKEKI